MSDQMHQTILSSDQISLPQEITSNPILPSYLILILMLCTLTISSMILLANQLGPNYIGNNYFPDNTGFCGLILLLTLMGCRLQFGVHHSSFKIAKELVYLYAIMTCIALFTNTIQLTPFQPIDPFIINTEALIPIKLTTLMAWAHQYPNLITILTWAYSSLDYQLTFIPLAIIFFKQKRHVIVNFYFLMLVTALIGFSIYYFFPTTAPASYLSSPYFSISNYATGLKFYQIHHYIPMTTEDGGLIAFPSFHAIWAFCCLYLVYEHKWIFYPLLLINMILLMACLLLGWHYFLDLIGSGLVVSTTYSLLRSVRKYLGQ